MHVVLAMGRGPHWLLSDEEAKQYGQALANAMRHLPITMAQKYVDFVTLGIAIVSYEGPRLGADMALRRQARERRQPRPPTNGIYPFPMQHGPMPPPVPPQGEPQGNA